MRERGRISQTTEVAVPFYDIDMMAVVWHGHYLKYLEDARWALMERIGYGLEAMKRSGYLWPIIDAHVRYVSPARCGDVLAITASLVEWHSRVAIHYLIADAAGKRRVARARTVQVAVDAASGELQFECPAGIMRAVERSLAGEAPA